MPFTWLVINALGDGHTHTPTFADERISRNQAYAGHRPMRPWFNNLERGKLNILTLWSSVPQSIPEWSPYISFTTCSSITNKLMIVASSISVSNIAVIDYIKYCNFHNFCLLCADIHVSNVTLEICVNYRIYYMYECLIYWLWVSLQMALAQCALTMMMNTVATGTMALNTAWWVACVSKSLYTGIIK